MQSTECSRSSTKHITFITKANIKCCWQVKKISGRIKKKYQNVNCLLEHEMTCKYKKYDMRGRGTAQLVDRLPGIPKALGLVLSTAPEET